MKSSAFQYIVLTVFGFLGLLGVLIFAGLIPIGGGQAKYEGEVLVWGFVPDAQMAGVVSELNTENQKTFTVRYEYIDRQKFENELINALARGDGPDLVVFPNDLIIKQGDKLMPIPYDSYPERVFRDTFAEAGDIFLNKDGVLALPLYADPLIMYWNKDLFTNAGLANYPKNWVDFLNLSNKLTNKDNKGNIFQSAVAMGTYRNISNAKEVMLTLLLQVGDGVISRTIGTNGEAYKPIIGTNARATESALNFYTEFSNPAKVSYSWNQSLPNSKDMFGEGKLAVYFGMASEYGNISESNPHLNFDVAVIPQGDDSMKRITYADVVGVAVTKASKIPTTAVKALYSLTNNNYGNQIAKLMFLPSLRRDVLSIIETDPIAAAFNDSALISQTWYDPDSSGSDSIFNAIIDSVISGRQSMTLALTDAKAKFFEYVK